MALPDGIYFDGRPVLLDLEHQLSSWLNKWLPQNICTPCPPKAHVDMRDQSYTDISTMGSGLPVPNYPARPPLQINQLYWPTGAMRWSVVHFVMTEPDVAFLQSRSYGRTWVTSVPRILYVKYGGSFVRTYMYLLDAKPLTPWKQQRLYLVTLVDERYWWQSIGLGAAPAGRPPTGPPDPVDLTLLTYQSWEEFFDTIATQLNLTYTTYSVDADYLYVDPYSMTRYFDNIAQVIDAACLSVGFRCVRDFDGRVYFMSRNASSVRRTVSSKIPHKIIAGDLWPAPPRTQRLLVAFPKMIYGHIDCKNWWHWVDVANWRQKGEDEDSTWDLQAIDDACHDWASASNPSYAAGVPGVSEVIYTSCMADFEEDANGDLEDCPENDTEIQALAKQIATDFFSYQAAGQMDITFAGMQRWLIYGYDDFVLFDWGTECEPEHTLHTPPPTRGHNTVPPAELKSECQRRYCTRVRSMPQDFGIRHQFTQDNAVPFVGEGEAWFKCIDQGGKDHKDPGDWAYFKQQTLAANGTFSDASPTLIVRLYDPAHMAFAIDAEVLKAQFSCTRSQWEPAEEFGLHRRGKVDEAPGINDGATGTVEIWESGVATGVTVEISHDWLAGGESVLDTKEVYILYDRQAEEWWDPGAQC